MTSINAFIIQSPPAGDWKLYSFKNTNKQINKNQKHCWSQSSMPWGETISHSLMFWYRTKSGEIPESWLGGAGLLFVLSQHYNCIFMLLYVFSHGMNSYRAAVAAQAASRCHCSAATPVAWGERWCPWVEWRHEGYAPFVGPGTPRELKPCWQCW